jgi:hypothetical protein
VFYKLTNFVVYKLTKFVFYKLTNFVFYKLVKFVFYKLTKFVFYKLANFVVYKLTNFVNRTNLQTYKLHKLTNLQTHYRCPESAVDHLDKVCKFVRFVSL